MQIIYWTMDFVSNTNGKDHWIFAAAGALHLHEFSETFILLNLLSDVDLFIDVCANVGFYTLLAGAQSNLNIISFEPNASTFQRLAKGVALNGLAQRVILLNSALGSTPGRQILHARAIGTGGESLLHVEDERPSESQQVEVRTLDQIFEQYALAVKNALIKIDVEGFEHAVLAGAAALAQIRAAAAGPFLNLGRMRR